MAGYEHPVSPVLPIQPNPAPRLFPPDGRKAGAFFDAAGSQRCGGRHPGMAGYERPVSLVHCPNRFQRSGFSLRTEGRSGRFLTPPVLSGARADSPAWRVMDTPHHPCAPNRIQRLGFSLRTGGGRALVLGCCSVPCGDIQPGRAAVCDILSGPAESKKTGSP